MSNSNTTTLQVTAHILGGAYGRVNVKYKMLDYSDHLDMVADLESIYANQGKERTVSYYTREEMALVLQGQGAFTIEVMAVEYPKGFVHPEVGDKFMIGMANPVARRFRPQAV